MPSLIFSKVFYGSCYYQRTSLYESRFNPTKAKLVLLKNLVLERNRINQSIMRPSALPMQIKCTCFNYNYVLTEELRIINDVSLVKSSAENITYSLALHFYSRNVQFFLLHTWHLCLQLK